MNSFPVNDITYNIPESWGNINSKKGIVSTFDATAGTIVYALSTVNCSTGTQVIIKTYTGTTRNLVERNTLVPEIPYRIFTNDYNHFNKILTPSLLNHKDAFLKFNPGIIQNGNKFVLVDDGNMFATNSTSMIQINVPRATLSSFSLDNEYQAWKNTNNQYTLHVGALYKAYDIQASIIVKKDEVEPELYDWIYLTVCSRVDINCRYINKAKSSSYNNDYWYYSMPVTLKYKVTKMILGITIPEVLVPVSWTYPLPLEWTYATNYPTYMSRINPINTSYATHMWNYNIIPSIVKKDYMYIPQSFGCLADMCYESDSKQLIYTSIGNYVRGKDSGGSPYRQTNTLCSVDLSSNGFCLPNSNSKALVIDVEDEICGQLTVESISGTYVALAHDSYTQNTNYTHLSFYDSNTLKNISNISFIGASKSDLTLQLETLYYKYNTDSQDAIVYQFPTINSTFISTLNSYFGTTHGVKNVFLNAGMILKSQLKTYPFERSFIQYAISTNPKKIFMIDKYSNDNTLIQNLSTINSKNLYLFFSSNNMIMSLIKYDSHQEVAYQIKDINSGQDEPMVNGESWIFNHMFGSQYDGYENEDYIISKIKSSYTPTVDFVRKYNPVNFTLGNTATSQYWADPTLGQNYLDDQETVLKDSQKSGITLIINIDGCNGIYSVANPLSLLSYNESLKPSINPEKPGGVEIDSITRPDISFKYSGIKSIFQSSFSSSQGGYWAQSDGILILTCKGPLGNNILYGSDKMEIAPNIWHYDHTGTFNMQFGLNLDLTNAGAALPYTHPDFILSNCELKVIFKNKYGKILATNSYVFDIDPPNGSGIIYTADNRTKTTAWMNFYLNRNATKGDVDYTEILNVSKIHRSIWKKEYNISPPYNYIENGISSKTFKMHSDAIGRGDYIYYQYEPKLNGTKPIIASNNGVAYSEMMTRCTGHKYWINNVSVRFGFGGSFGNNVIDDIKNQNPFIYIDTINSSCEVKTTLDIHHENWADGSIRDLNVEESIYPLISGIYMLVIDEQLNRSQYFNLTSLPALQTTFKAYDDALTYPNIDLKTTPAIKHLINVESDGVYATGLFMSPTVTSLENQEITVDIKKSGRYRIYLEVEDEFGQFSTWCITNKQNNFNYPFNEL